MNIETQTTRPARNYFLIVSLAANAILAIGACAAFFAYLQNSRALDAERTNLTLANRDLDSEKANVAALQSRLSAQAARAQTAETTLAQERSRPPSIPIRVGFRRSQLGQGIVSVFSNYSSRRLPLLIAVLNPTTAKSKRFTLQVAPGGRVELGHLEGWQFASGDQLELQSAGFETARVTVP